MLYDSPCRFRRLEWRRIDSARNAQHPFWHYILGYLPTCAWRYSSYVWLLPWQCYKISGLVFNCNSLNWMKGRNITCASRLHHIPNQVAHLLWVSRLLREKMKTAGWHTKSGGKNRHWIASCLFSKTYLRLVRELFIQRHKSTMQWNRSSVKIEVFTSLSSRPRNVNSFVLTGKLISEWFSNA